MVFNMKIKYHDCLLEPDRLIRNFQGESFICEKNDEVNAFFLTFEDFFLNLFKNENEDEVISLSFIKENDITFWSKT